MYKKGDSGSAIIRDIILGGQDGLVNVLGIVLAVAIATHSRYIILISGLAATFAESISMAAVAYTSAKAGKEFYIKREKELSKLAKKNPSLAAKEIKRTLAGSGLEGTFLNKAISHVISSKKRLHKAVTSGDHAKEFAHPLRDSVVVGFAAIIGSLVPLVPFFLLSIQNAFFATLIFATIILFITGALKGKYTGVSPLKSGIEMALVGMTAAIAGFLIGYALGALPLV